VVNFTVNTFTAALSTLQHHLITFLGSVMSAQPTVVLLLMITGTGAVWCVELVRGNGVLYCTRKKAPKLSVRTKEGVRHVGNNFLWDIQY